MYYDPDCGKNNLSMNKEMIELTLSTENERGLDFTKVCTDKTKVQNGEKSNTCNQCKYASSWAGNLRRHLITQSGEKQRNVISVTIPPLWQELEDALENTHRRKVKHMQPMRLYILVYKRFEETFENTQWGKNKEM